MRYFFLLFLTISIISIVLGKNPFRKNKCRRDYGKCKNRCLDKLAKGVEKDANECKNKCKNRFDECLIGKKDDPTPPSPPTPIEG